ncbi:MAG: phosphoribosylaminoimidazolesuccinocarboxamide synthase [Rickettsiales bacterium]|jgi:phosphoribosylaminoimidazole-succinocarboxamide synthase|nr:phosphoribosylaminoimidazolesuccinocarboxamide synthase [Rickettsiales bacterium]
MAKPQIKPDFDFIPLPLLNVGKVRETYKADDKYLLIVTTDRISALDVVLKSKIPGKGIVLNQMSNFWMEKLAPNSNHIVDKDIESIARGIPALKPVSQRLKNRAILVKKLDMFPLECIVRGYFTGSVVKKYNEDNNGMLMGHDVGKGLVNWQKFPKGAIYTPSTKAELGLHDENITVAQAGEILNQNGYAGFGPGIELVSLKLFKDASEYALGKGIVLIDTKVELGREDENIILGDEAFTPDSSRFVASDEYEKAFAEKRDPASLDKEPVRRLVRAMKKNYEGELPQQELVLADEDIKNTVAGYTDVYFNLVGEDYNLSAARQLYAIRSETGVKSR